MAKEGSSDYKKVRKRWFFKEPLTEWFFVEPKMVLQWHRCEEPFEASLLLRVKFLFQDLRRRMTEEKSPHGAVVKVLEGIPTHIFELFLIKHT